MMPPAFHRAQHTAGEWFDYLADRIAPEPNSGCWLWTGGVCGKGYAVGPGPTRMHRVIYENIHGEVGALTVDHLCRVRCCVNPAHLEPVTNKTNILRGVGPTAINAAKAFCKRGHPLSGTNLRPRPGIGRECRQCKWASNERRARKIYKTKRVFKVPHLDKALAGSEGKVNS